MMKKTFTKEINKSFQANIDWTPILFQELC